MTKKVAQNALAFYGGDITALRGWDALAADKQDEVREVFESLINAPEPEKKPKAKKTKKADDDDDVVEVAPPKKKKAAPKAEPAVAMPGDDD